MRWLARCCRAVQQPSDCLLRRLLRILQGAVIQETKDILTCLTAKRRICTQRELRCAIPLARQAILSPVVQRLIRAIDFGWFVSTISTEVYKG